MVRATQSVPTRADVQPTFNTSINMKDLIIQAFTARRSVLRALLVITVFILIAAMFSACSSIPPARTVSEWVRVDSVEQISPRNVHEEMNIPIHRIYWENGVTTTVHGVQPPTPGDSVQWITYDYRTTHNKK